MIYLGIFDYRAGAGAAERRALERRMGRLLLEFGLEREMGEKNAPPTADLIFTKNGKPLLADCPGLHFNISHTEGLAVCAFSGRRVGADAELIRPGPVNSRLFARVCAPREQAWIKTASCPGEAFVRLWTLKESYVKATGEGLSFPLSGITFDIDGEGRIRGSIPGWHFYQQRVYGKYIISVCEADQEGAAMTYQEMFEAAKKEFMKADVSQVKEHLAFQFNITGDGAGAFYAEVKEGVLYVEPYEYYDRDAIFTCSSDTLFKLIRGKMDPVLAFTLGKLKVDGSIEQALKVGSFMKASV